MMPRASAPGAHSHTHTRELGLLPARKFKCANEKLALLSLSKPALGCRLSSFGQPAARFALRNDHIFQAAQKK